MARITTRDILVGVLSFHSNKELPADASALQKAFFKFSELYPQVMSHIQFQISEKSNPFSQEIENTFNELMFSNIIALSGDMFENIFISSKIEHLFERDKFTEEELNSIERMGFILPRSMRRNESIRHRKLVKS
jgi:hypothetical protein